MNQTEFAAALNSERLKKITAISAEQHIRTQQLSVLYKQRPLAFFGMLVAAIVINAVLWDVIDRPLMIGWNIAIVFVLLFNVLWYFAYRRFSIYPNKIRLLDWGFSLEALLHGCTWGAIGLFVISTNNDVAILVVIITLVGMATGGIATSAAVYRSFLCLMIPVLFPISYSFAFGEYLEAWEFVGKLLLGYIIVLAIAGYEFYRVVGNSFRLRYENSGLVENLVAEKLRSEAMVKELETEVSERKKAEDSIRLAMEEANAANTAKSRFLANMSHEIRTPLASIIGFAEMAGDESDPIERKQSINTIIRSGKHLLEIINDILDLSKIESEKLDVERIEVPLIQMISDIEFTFSALAQERGITLRVEYDFPVPETIESDPTRLRQIIFNLMSNAIKFSENGDVVLRLEYEQQTRKLGINVTDSGIGMTQDEQSRLFQPFSQADVSTTRKYGGTGLGLAISKKLAEMLGGDLACTSNKGKGSCFSLWIDAGELSEKHLINNVSSLVMPAAMNKLDAVPQLKGRVLVVDDSPDMQRLVCIFLRRTGVEYETANNGKEGVELTLSGSFDLILMDMQMPVMDGMEAISYLRKAGVEIPILAMTANVQEEEKRAYQRVGANGHISKPIDQHAFYQSIGRYLSAGNHQAEEVSEEKEEMSDLIEQFKSRLRELLDEMGQCISNNDITGLEERSHVIKGLGGSFGFPEVTNLAATLNQHAKDGDMQSCIPAFDKLKAYAESGVF